MESLEELKVRSYSNNQQQKTRSPLIPSPLAAEYDRVKVGEVAVL